MAGPLIPRLQEVYHVGYAVVSLIFILAAAGYISGACAYVYLTDRFGFGVVIVIASILVAIGTAIEVFAPPFPVFVVGCFLVGFGTMFLVFAFKFKSQEDCLKAIGQSPCKTEDALKGIDKFKQVFRLPAVHTMAFFLFTYAGIEVTFAGWIVTFVIKERHSGPDSGYISSGFWGGYTVGRLVLIPRTKKLGPWRAMFLYILLSLGLVLVIWLVPSFTVNAVAIVFLGFFLGPVCAIVMTHAGRILPPELIGGAISWMVLFTAAGAVVFPFITGAIASRTSINNLPPLTIAMLGLTLIVWTFVPKHRAKLT